ncbi:hypothetical protein HK13_08920 [Acetobacter indonesiensis]|uniref:IclR family transcriptional regulator domain-containing protein n=1 Tax=Acetobacter indonesiensis TaxID=104101 RepID=UPI000A39A6A9|nr:IclR family transcriptional regulator C-terminal domain-containing protein [Acetobacter indonesiensis]OUI92726.1 hypothetical protein HK13_08920 [Acetobacter indonesiensis]
MGIESTEESAESRDFVTALARGLDVLRVCAGKPEGLTLSEVANFVALPRAAVRRSLITLVSTGYLFQTGRLFIPTTKVLSLSARVKDMPLPRLAQPILESLSKALDESASLAVLDGKDILYIGRAEANRILSVDLSVGARLPAWCTSMGRVLLASLSEEERKQHIPEQLTMRTVHTIGDKSQLNGAFDSIRKQGFCLLDQELELGLRSVAAPVHDSTGKVIAALNVGMHAARLSLDAVNENVVPAVVKAAQDLSEAIQLQNK